jgi:hypothetical protein
MNDLSFCRPIILAQCGLRVNLYDSRDIDAFLIESCPALYLLSLKLAEVHIRHRCPLYIDLTYFILEFFPQR